MKVKLGDIDKYKNTYSLIIDEEVWQTVHLSIFGRSPSFPNTTEEELNSRFELLEYKGAKAFVLRRLSQKNYHSQELLGALAKRSVSKVTACAHHQRIYRSGVFKRFRLAFLLCAYTAISAFWI